MTYPHPDPTDAAEALREAQLRGEGRGCGGCRYLGFGPGIAGRCVHPRRWCYAVSLTTWALGCADRVDLLAKFHRGADPHPERVELGDHCDGWSRWLRKALQATPAA